MSMETKRPDENQHGSNGPGYEKRDAKISNLAIFGLVLAFVLFISFVGMKWTLDYFQRTQPLGPPASPVATSPIRAVGPKLQAFPHQELVDYCNAQEKKLNSYGWIDQQSGVVRIPVDRAIELTLERGLPTRSGSSPAAGTGIHPVGNMDAPLPEGVGGPCGYLYKDTHPADAGEAEMPKD